MIDDYYTSITTARYQTYIRICKDFYSARYVRDVSHERKMKKVQNIEQNFLFNECQFLSVSSPFCNMAAYVGKKYLFEKYHKSFLATKEIEKLFTCSNESYVELSDNSCSKVDEILNMYMI